MKHTKNTLIAFVVCSAIVLGLCSPKIADAYTNVSVATSVAPSSPFLVTYDGVDYHADSQSTASSYTGTLKSVVESAVAELEAGGGGTVEFAAGTFDLGSEFFKLQQIHNITLEGQGIDVTYIQNSSSDAADTEPFNLSGAFGVTIRDMTVSAGGSARTTSDALDFDEGNDSLVERVKITASRGHGIVFDGKGAGWTSENNIVRDCVIENVADTGVEFLASSSNVIEDCTITNAGRHGIEAGKSSPTAAQPNKKSNDNIIRNNTIDNSGIDGIIVNSGDNNRIENNDVTNSSNNVAGADGIRITSSDSIPCDDNIVDGNVATDNQPTKTQRYGLNIASPLCNRTVVEGNNDFSGNRVAAINDMGTGTQYGVDTLPPTAPTGLTAVGAYKTRVDLSWTASVDSVGVTGYEVWRNDALLATIGAQTTYSDATVAPGSTHSYKVRARDAAGNPSAFSNSDSATTPTTGLLFHDGFETGDFSQWTSANGVAIQNQNVFAGSWGAEAIGTNTAAFATKQLAHAESSLYWQIRFRVLSQSTNTNLMRFRTAAGAAILTAFVSSSNKIGYRNDVAGVSTTSNVTASPGNWHALQVHVVINGAASQTEVWLDGAQIAGLSNTESLGTNLIGRLELGDSSITHTYDIVLDEIDFDLEMIPDAGTPTVPANLVATPHSGLRVDLTWDGSSDDLGVAEYEIYRDNTLLGTVPGSETTYSDATTEPLTSYAYKVRARDAANNFSDFSNTSQPTTGDAFSDDFETGGLSKWSSVTMLLVQQAQVDTGQWAVQATSNGTHGSSAQVQLDRTLGELYYRVRFRLASLPLDPVSLLRFRAADNTALASVFVSSLGILTYRNDGTSTLTTTNEIVTPSFWHEIQMHVLAGGGASQVDVWLDGVQVLSQADSLSPGAIGRLELGDPSLTRVFDVAFDNVIADPTFISDAVAPSAPANLHSTSVTATTIDLAWDAASDNVGVVKYRLRRDGLPIAEINAPALSYSDTGRTPNTQYTYTVTALDAAGRESPLSNSLQVTTSPGNPTVACWPFPSPPPAGVKRCK